MPRALPLAARQEIVERHHRGQTLAHIATELGIPYVTVRAIWRAFRDRGADGLVPGYHACGSSTPAYPQSIIRLACQLRRAHPRWGAGRIRLELLEHHKPATVPSARVLQRAFQRAGINRPRRRQRPVTALKQATAPHELWQVDAVEKARLQTGALVSWMAVTDQFTGAMLANELSPPGLVAVHHPEPSPDALSPRVPAVGTATANPIGQWPSLGTELWPAAGPGAVAAGAGSGSPLDPARPTPEKRNGRTR